ncbi:hypothetical protein FT663_01751 [Candidozyma haemuli var. vulneris]|uniref:DUF985 domain-containing protein n=1 Tax=Candidozyma haemuli TaxID=45357 RepID=A0A2V1ARY2_9ASCO|nr:hypothetical protein CXQ85_002339 [[Candida] haemuloni]KAF3989507.1 hypothetical protein FT662_02776 [[Candida] haemuloni var. vulneris]KAF3993762.1 hypothetical protein FT663_01751 [[Candida] haemuloni var. vulneris]PVH20545.1 hypothetical protein CXQ85_002339 [[Candida] haemuloni]
MGDKWIKALDLQPHPEGGYYSETGRSRILTKSETGLEVPLYTNIHFLLEDKNPSRFHRLHSEEVWYFHDGQPLTVHCIYPNGEYKKVKLGKDPSAGEVVQFEVPRGVIFGSSVETGWALVSCMVSPGFDFKEFHLFEQTDLLGRYPEHAEIIKCLT